MSHFRTIVAATDLSTPSRHAADRAAKLATAQGATLTLLHALGSTALDDLKRWLGDSDAGQAVVETDARERLNKLALELGDRHALHVSQRLVTGQPVKALTEHAREVGADLVVTGTRGAGFFRGVSIGSTAERIANLSGRPALMVRQAAHEPYQRVLVPVDFSPWSFNSILLALQAAPGATLILMHAVQIPFEGKMRYAGVADTLIDRYLGEARREARQKLQELAARTGLPAGRIRLMAADGGAPWMLIAQQEQEYDCDLIVVGRQGRNAAEDLLLGSTARTVMAECSADVLVSTSSEP